MVRGGVVCMGRDRRRDLRRSGRSCLRRRHPVRIARAGNVRRLVQRRGVAPVHRVRITGRVGIGRRFRPLAPQRVGHRAEGLARREHLAVHGHLEIAVLGGEEVDGRSDVWAIGVVLYEMVAGRRAFAADNEQAILLAITTSDPTPIDNLRAVSVYYFDRVAVFQLQGFPLPCG